MPATDPPPTLPPRAGTERAFHVRGLEPVGADAADGVRGWMDLGAWTLDDDATPAAGVLAVLLDAVLARAALSGVTVEQRWLTSELSIDLCDRLPATGGAVATGRAVHTGEVETVATAEAHAGDRLLAVATTRGRLRRATSPLHATMAEPLPSVRDVVRTGDEPGRLLVHPTPGVTNQQGLLHGGVTACVAEMAARRALGGDLHTSALRVHYLRPLPTDAGPIRVHTDVEHRGRSLGLVRVSLLRPDGRAGAVAIVTATA